MRLSKNLIYFFGALGGLLFGYDTGVIAGAQILIQEELHLSNAEIGFVVSCILIGAVVGAILISPLSDRYGRKKMVILTALIFLIGALGSGFSPNVSFLIISRMFLGIAVGGASALVPMYLAELAPANQRGSLSSLNQLMIMIGMLLAYIANYVWRLSPIGWELMLGFAALPALILFIGGILLPESPRYLVKVGKREEAENILLNIRTKSEAEAEILEIEEQSHQEKGRLKDVFSKWVRPAVVAAFGLAILQQWMGCNTVFYYAPRILMSGGTDAASAIRTQIFLGIFYVIVTAVAVSLMDRFDRRKVLIFGAIGMGLSFFALSAAFHLEGDKAGFHLFTFIFLATYISSFCATWGPVMWVMIGEIFPLKIRGLAVGIASLVNWVANWTVSVSFPVLEAKIGDVILFISFGLVCIAAAFFVKSFVFETRGYTLEQIEEALLKDETKKLNDKKRASIAKVY
ncbi:sugar porter family MFS transporter [Listeria booriae]|uniref:Sugar porter family MFS transporter n=1 Tax=Listeria booriae TaxID=1552123 RepID=A0A7X1CGD7_9LIST|nr:sugar porter family MFS transporter [Listeria booriae]MBC1563368.1 sugar porter family MFS transporter [Listeria booriae]MBC1574912.1 sugar porter family MFS transporter [Listeria booriae]MBC1779897.1 sugar porter family MFS transporter [Listeria booriae]MBC1975307.1 sugar porter family MFS transporter [Listeria booriae]MBC2033016.1 sugar porter family MFS transporter [Listeria booriae]